MPPSLPRLFLQAKQSNRKISMLSLYDAPAAALACEAGVDCLLIGDSMGNVILGHAGTVPVTLDDIEHHTRAVVRGVRASSRPDVPVIADLPFGAYHDAHLVANATRLMQAGASGLKLEGAGTLALQACDTLGQMGVPVMGHLGFTPQSQLALSSVVQGRTAHDARHLLHESQSLQVAGAFALVLEAVTTHAAAMLTRELQLSTIGIGAGLECDGQVLVWHDLVGLSGGAPLKFVRRYAELQAEAARATSEWVRDVQNASFPGPEHGWAMSADERERLEDEAS